MIREKGLGLTFFRLHKTLFYNKFGLPLISFYTENDSRIKIKGKLHTGINHLNWAQFIASNLTVIFPKSHKGLSIRNYQPFSHVPVRDIVGRW